MGSWTLDRRRWTLAALLLFALFLGRIASLYDVYSDTYDEHAHLREAFVWLETGRFRGDGFQSPLPRLLIAAGARAGGFDSDEPWLHHRWEGQSEEAYWRSLTLARLAVLPFIALLFWTVAWWSRKLYGGGASLAALTLLTMSPTVLGHSALATLDASGAAGVALALAASWSWMQRPTLVRAAGVGAAIGLAQMAKFSAFGFLAAPTLWAALIAMRRSSVQRSLLHVAALAASAAVVIWGAYGFDFGAIHSFRQARAAGTPEELPLAALAQGVRTPAPHFFQGFLDLAYLQQAGHPAFFLGEQRQTGWRAYFPVALALKATPPLLLLAGWGLLCGWRRNRAAAAFLAIAATGILAVSIPSAVNIGVRHLLPLFPVLSILGGFVFERPLRRKARSAAALALLGWHVAESLAAHPHYIAYFTPPARSRDYFYLSDSNLAWGQDRWRLREWLLANPEKDVRVLGYEASPMLADSGLDIGEEEAEWLLLDANIASIILAEHPQSEAAALLREGPTRRIGRSILALRRGNGD